MGEGERVKGSDEREKEGRGERGEEEKGEQGERGGEEKKNEIP